jgi:hypothetical protein
MCPFKGCLYVQSGEKEQTSLNGVSFRHWLKRGEPFKPVKGVKGKEVRGNFLGQGRPSKKVVTFLTFDPTF